MARLTKEELGGMRLLARDKRASGFVYVSVHHEHITSALDELEEHRAKETNVSMVEPGGVLLSEEVVERIWDVLERAERLLDDGEVRDMFTNALALLPPKRAPSSVTECAKNLLATLAADGYVAGCAFDIATRKMRIAALRAAIEREGRATT